MSQKQVFSECQWQMSHELTDFLGQWNGHIIKSTQKRITLNHTTLRNIALPKFEVFIRISLDMNLFLNLALLTFLLFDETDLDDSIDSGNLYERGYRPLIQNDSITHMHDLAVCVKETISLLPGLSLRNSVDLYLYFLFYAFSFIDHLHFSIQFFMLFHLT